MSSETDSQSDPQIPDETQTAAETQVSRLWVWGVCGLLLLASSINYMDRQTLASISVRITNEFELTNSQFANLEVGFGWAFAFGALFFGWLADRSDIRWLYPAVLLAWSAMGFFTGWAETFLGLLVFRTLLGFFEAGHWPCGLKTTQRLLPPSLRTLGNSVLQSGTAIGAIITPLILVWMLTDTPGSWRLAFQVIGLVGVGWTVLWFLMIRGKELAPAPVVSDQLHWDEFLSAICSRRFLTMACVVILINACYHVYRVWMPRYLIAQLEIPEHQVLYFQSAFYVFNDVGCLGAGFLTAGLCTRGWSVHGSRMAVFGLCAVLTSLSLSLPFLSETRWLLMGVMLLVSMGSLGMFPCYYSLTQDLSRSHLGKVTGLLGALAWWFVGPIHKGVGIWIDLTQRTDWALALAGLLPVAAVFLILVGWGPDPKTHDDLEPDLEPDSQAE